MASPRWTDVSADPNSSFAVQFRAGQLQDAWAAPAPENRVEALISYARSKRVLDIGCVDHDFLAQQEGNEDPAHTWLHARVADAALTCVGMDYDEEGVQAVQARGYRALHHDITLGPGPATDEGPFDVVIAGEVIEHLSHVQALFDFAYGVLEPGGLIAISTPNPYAPWRVRAGQKRYVWESVDHVTYLFPSGIVELADRAGLVLRSAYTVEYPSLRQSLAELRHAVVKRLRGQTGRPGLRPLDLDLRIKYVGPVERLMLIGRPQRGWLGEYAIYALARP